MRFEHGSHRTECLAALPLLICAAVVLSTSAVVDHRPLFGTELRQCLPLDDQAMTRLRFCDAYEPDRLLHRNNHSSSSTTTTDNNRNDRRATCDDRPGLDHLRLLDEKASIFAAQFGRIIDRYDCENANSVSWTCKDCEEAYKQWVCAMFLPPVRVEGEVESLRPCRYLCRLVEQRCPYFHPSVKEQYAGERVFKCIDPDIPDLDNIQGHSSYGLPHRCYCPHHLDPGAADGRAEPECQLLSPAQLRKKHHRQSGSGSHPVANSMLLMMMLAALWWTTR